MLRRSISYVAGMLLLTTLFGAVALGSFTLEACRAAAWRYSWEMMTR